MAISTVSVFGEDFITDLNANFAALDTAVDALEGYFPSGVASVASGGTGATTAQAAAESLDTAFVVEDLAALKALTSRPESVTVETGAAAGFWQWELGSVTATDDVDVVECTSGTAGRYLRIRSRLLSSGIDLNGRLSAVATITPYPSSTILEANTGIYAVQTWSGSRTDSGTIVANVMNITDTASLGDGTGAGGTHIGIGFLLAHYFGGSSVKGTRTALSVQAIQTEQTGNTGDNYSYTPLAATMVMEDTEGGTGVTAATAKGLGFGANVIVEFKAAATNMYGAYGMEVNTGLRTGSTVFGKSGLVIVQLDHDVVAGTVYDAAVHIANGAGGTAVGWKKGIVFGRYDGTAPMQSTGVLLTGEGVAGSGSWGTIDTAIDFSGFTITTNLLKGPGSSIGGTGAAAFTTLALTGNITVTKANPSITMTNSSASSCFVRYVNSVIRKFNTVPRFSPTAAIDNSAFCCSTFS